MTSDDVRVSDQQALVVELMQALESGVHGDELRRFFHEDAEQIEYPSLVDPRVGRRDLHSMINLISVDQVDDQLREWLTEAYDFNTD